MSSLGLVELAKQIREIIADVKSTDSRLRVVENALSVGVDPVIPAAGFSNVLMDRVMYPVRVTSVMPEQGYFSGRVCRIEDGMYGTPAFADDPDFPGELLDVDVPVAGRLPQVGDVVGALFNGTTGNDYAEMYALLDRIHYLTILSSCSVHADGVLRLDFGPCFRVTATSSTEALVKLGNRDGLTDSTITFFTGCERGGDFLSFSYAQLRFYCGVFSSIVTQSTTSVYVCCCEPAEGGEGTYELTYNLADLRSRLWNRFSGE